MTLTFISGFLAAANSKDPIWMPPLMLLTGAIAYFYFKAQKKKEESLPTAARKSPKSASPPKDKITILADQFLNEEDNEGDKEAFKSALERLSPKELTESEKERWYHLRGALAFQLGRRDEALKIFYEGTKLFPESDLLQFSLGQEYENLGKIQEMLLCWEKVRLENTGSRFILAMARYLYLWGFPDKAQNKLDSIFKAYAKLKILDDHFLYVRGLPFFGEAFDFRAAFYQLQGNLKRASEELEEIARVSSDYDFDRIRLYLAALREGDWQTFLKGKEASESAFARMEYAVWTSRQDSDYQRARKRLEDFRLNSNDFAWLEDVRTLALAETESRFGHEPEERRFLEVFFKKQPLLFEPNHAFSFGFLDYQEKLRKEYQRNKKTAK